MTETIATLRSQIATAVQLEQRAIERGSFQLFLAYRQARNEREAMLTTLTKQVSQ